jgi:peptide/nickel transport system substrate-binding protein
VNGRAFEAEDVVYSFERMRGEDPGLRHRANLSGVSTITAVDPQTVEVKLEHPSATVFEYMANSFQVIVPREAVEEFGDLRQQGIGTGPFILVQAEQTVTFRVERNPNYWATDRPYFDAVRADVVPDKSSRISALRGGASHVEAAALTIDDALPFEGDSDYVLETAPYNSWGNMAYNCSVEPFSDQRVRKAFDLVWDRGEFVDLALGGAGSITGPVNAGLPFFALPQEELSTLPGYRDDKEADLQEAQGLLDAAGQRPLEVTMLYHDRLRFPPAAPLSLDQIERSGLEIVITPEVIDFASHTPRTLEGDYQLTCSQLGFFNYADIYLHGYHRTDSGRNEVQYSNPEMDELLDRQQQITDPDERQELIFDIQRRLLEEAPRSWLFASDYFEIWTARLQNYHVTVHNNRARQMVDAWLEA